VCFQDNINPALDFTEVPPGILALDNIVYFAKMHAESFTKVELFSVNQPSFSNQFDQ